MNRAVLAQRGHEVSAAYSGAEARGRLETLTPDIVVLDVMMDSMTEGFELARDLHEKLPAMPMIMLSGVREATGVRYRISPDETWLPVARFLDKPIDPAALADEVDNVLAKKD
jgi:CheY-like chemotaxis protein